MGLKKRVERESKVSRRGSLIIYTRVVFDWVGGEVERESKMESNTEFDEKGG